MIRVCTSLSALQSLVEHCATSWDVLSRYQQLQIAILLLFCCSLPSTTQTKPLFITFTGLSNPTYNNLIILYFLSCIYLLHTFHILSIFSINLNLRSLFDKSRHDDSSTTIQHSRFRMSLYRITLNIWFGFYDFVYIG